MLFLGKIARASIPNASLLHQTWAMNDINTMNSTSLLFPLNYDKQHGRRRRQQLGIKLIQRRWRQRQRSNDESGSHDGSHDDSDDLSAAENSSKKRSKRLQRSDSNDDRGDDSTTTTSCSNDTKNTTAADLSLLFRRNSNSSSISTMISPRHYSQLQFVSASSGGSDVILLTAIDNYGDLDIIRSSRRCGEGSTTRGSILQANRMSIFASPSSSNFAAAQNNHHYENDSNNNNVMAGVVEGPRQPMNNNFHYEIYSYDLGNKLAIGLRGGRVQLFGSTERAAAAKRNNNSSSSVSTTNNNSSTTNARGARLLWSCLPSTSVTIGPQRRYRRNDQYPLSRILSSSSNTNNNATTSTTTSSSIRERENVLDAYNTFIFEEISDWDRVDDDYYFTLRRRGGSSAALNRMILGDGCPWAFREGSSNGGNGMSGTALIGACVDIDNGDCFSLRVIDERCCFTSSPASSSSCCNSTMNVIVVDDYPSKQGNGSGGGRCNERVDSVCFSGEFGLVTSHSITNAVADNQELTATSIKWWDHRMLRSHEPVNSLCLSFPRDNVSLLSPEREMYLDGSSFDNNSHPKKPSAAASLRKLTRDQPLDCTNYDKFRVKRLVGSRDSSDRFAIHLKLDSSSTTSLQQSSYRLPRRHNECDELILMVDSCRGEITQEVRNLNSGGLSPSISSYLDTMACFTTVDGDEDVDEEEEDEKQCISIYDVSRDRDYGATNNTRNNPYNSLSGKKRQYRSSSSHYSVTSDDDNEAEQDGLLQRLCPKVHDAYGLQSSITCMTIDGYGETIACGTSDGDIFVCNCSDL